MGASKPYMPLMMGDWIRGTRGMKAQVKGVYIGLLIHQFDNGYIPDDYDELCLIEPELPSVWERLKDKFPLVDEGKRQNEKMEETRRFWSKQRKNGQSGGRPKNVELSNPFPQDKTMNLTDDILDLALEIGKKWDFDDRHQIQYSLCCRFIYMVGIDQVKKQFDGYWRYKEETREKTHSFRNWVGAEKEGFSDGAWCERDWSRVKSKVDFESIAI